jgi:hypothetical protein
MFSMALEEASKYTLPVIFTRRYRRGNIASSLGTFVVINQDGWIITADHIAAEIAKVTQSQQEMATYELQKAAIQNDAGLKDEG